MGMFASLLCRRTSVSLMITYLIVIVLSIVKATKGERFVIPGVSEFADKF